MRLIMGKGMSDDSFVLSNVSAFRSGTLTSEE